MAHRIRMLRGNLELDLPGRAVRVPTAPTELGALLLLALHPGRELSLDVFKAALFEGDPGFVSDGAIHTPISRLRRAGFPIRRRRYVLELEPADVDIVDVDGRARDFIEAATAGPERLGEHAVRDLVELGDELHRIWRRDPAEAVGHRPSLSTLFDPHRRRHRRFGLAFARLMAVTGDLTRAAELLADYVERYGDDITSSELRRVLAHQRETTRAVGPSPRGTLGSAGSPARLRVQVGRPPLRARAFRPRRNLADPLGVLATPGNGTAAGTVVLIGSGGVGKTQMAADVFARAQDAGVEVLLWVNGSSRESILMALADASAAAGIGERSDLPVERAADRFLDWLATTERSCLVVLDDVTDANDVTGLWPRGPCSAVLVTTRSRGLVTGEATPLVVEAFTESESVSYLEDRLSGSPGDPVRADVLDGAPELAAELGHLPLALSHAVSVIAQGGITCSDYRRRLADRSTGLDDLFAARPADEYAHTIANTWALGIERADALPPVGLARLALAVAAVVDPNGAADTIWGSGPILAWATAVRARQCDADGDAATGPVSGEDMRRALRNLHQFSLVTHDPNGGPLAVRAHVMVQRAQLWTLSTNETDALVRAVADGLVTSWPQPEIEPALSQSLRASATSLLRHGASALWVDGVHPLLLAVGDSLGTTGLVHQAVAWYTDLVQNAIRYLGPDHPDTLTVRGNLADWRGESGEPAAAAAACRELLADCCRVLGADHAQSLTTRHNLAYWRGHAGDPAGAAVAFEELLAELVRVLGPDHPDTLTARTNAADWRGEAGDLAGAMVTATALLDSHVRILGPDHPDTLATRHSIADWLGQSGNPAAAAEAFEQVVADHLRLLGPDHPDTLTARQNLAYWRGHAGDPAGALAAAETVLTDRLRLLGPDHPDTLATRGNIVHWLGETGDATGALLAAEELVADRLRVLGPDHPDTLTSRHNVALWQGYAGDPAGALATSTDLDQTCRRVLGPDHPHTLATRHNMAHWQGENGDPAGAAAAFEELLADRLRVLGADHPHTLATRHNMAHWRGENGDPAGAAAMLRALAADRRRILGADHPHTCITRHDAAHWEEQAGGPASPGETLEQLVADRDRRCGAGQVPLVRRDVTYWQRQARRVIRRSWQRNARRLQRPWPRPALPQDGETTPA